MPSSRCLGVILCVVFAAVCCRAQADTASTGLNEFAVVSAASDGSSLVVTPCQWVNAESPTACEGSTQQLKVDEKDAALKSFVQSLNPGDHVSRVLADANGPAVASLQIVRKSLSATGHSTPFWTKFLAFAGWAGALLLISLALTRGHVLKLIVGMDNRYSNSKFQAALWFWVLISSYLSVFHLRVLACGWDFVGGVNIPTNLLVLSGLSALTFGGAKAITTAKNNAAQAASAAAQAGANVAGAPAAQAAAVGAALGGEQAGAGPEGAGAAAALGGAAGAAVAAAPAAAAAAALGAAPAPKIILPKNSENFFKDLIQNDVGQVDFGDFQMVIVTLLAVVTYIVVLFHFMDFFQLTKQVSLPDVDTTILATFGVGQGAYLTKKAAGNPGTS
jgi:hypothetical protein